MKNIKNEELILEYLENRIEKDRKKEIEIILKEAGYNLNELEDLKYVQNNLEEITIPEPSENMDNNFYQMLEKQKRHSSIPLLLFKNLINWLQNINHQKVVTRLAYSFVLLFTGWIIGFWFTPDSRHEAQITTMTSEIHEMKEMMTLTLLNQPSPSDRIKALSNISEHKMIDDKILHYLIEILNNDPNVNVRLITVEVLSGFSNQSKVKNSLIESINLQESPLVQIALADAMIKLEEKDSVIALQKLLERRDLNHTVRKRIVHGLQILI